MTAFKLELASEEITLSEQVIITPKEVQEIGRACTEAVVPRVQPAEYDDPERIMIMSGIGRKVVGPYAGPSC